MKIIIRTTMQAGLALITSSFFPNLSIPYNGNAALFVVVAIMFSIGMSLLISFNTEEVRNLAYLKKIDGASTIIRKSFIEAFSIALTLHLVNSIIPSFTFTFYRLHFDLSVLVMIVQTFIVIYFIYNISEIADFKKRLSDRIREEKEKKGGRINRLEPLI